MNKCIFSLLFVFLFFSVNAQPELKFTRYTTQEGLVHNDVLSICQDSLGFLWFGTKHGCGRFDGIEFKNYQYREDIPGSIGPGWVNQIVCDNKNRLWFAMTGSNKTLVRYDYASDKFIDVSADIKSKLNIKDNKFDLWTIFSDSEGLIWFFPVSSDFMYYNPDTREIKTFNNYNNAPSSPSITRSVLEDVKHNIWFATSKGLYIYNKKTDSFTSYKNDPDNGTSISSDNCNSIFQDSENQIWIGTNVGLNRVTQFSKSFSFKRFVHEPQNPYSLSQNLTYDIAEDVNNNLLIATVNGLCMMNKKSNKIYRYYNSDTGEESINSNLVRVVYRDKYDNIWIATNNGIGKLQMRNFKSFSQSSYANSISHNKVQYVCEASNTDIWIATPRGIDVFNRGSGEFRFLAGITRNENGLYGAPLTFCPDKDKGMWIGTWNGGFSYFNYATHKIKNYITVPPTQSITDVFSVFQDSNNRLWITSAGEGVYVYNLETGEYKIILHNEKDTSTLSYNNPAIIMEDSESDIWLGTFKGLNMLTDFTQGTFKRYLMGSQINHIIESSAKCLWVATGNGLYQINKAEQKVKKFDSRDGLPGNVILGVLEDGDKNLWVSTDKGIVCVTLKEGSFNKITAYRKEEGVNVGDFIERSCSKLSDGTMIFGGTKGFCMFQPSAIKNDTVSPPVVFTNLKIANKLVSVGQSINGQIVLEKSISITNNLVLNYKNNVFSIEFAGLQYNMPQYNQYCYRLEGYDKDNTEWHYTDADNRKVEYMNLSSGNYTFKVKAANSHGIWNKKPAELKIAILPPWWQTLWFKFFVVVVLIAFVILIIRIRTYNLQKQKQALKKLVEKRTEELREMNDILRERMEELEVKTIQIEGMAKQIHEADQSKLRFFANISHEFRTPLTLIIGPLEKFLTLKQPVDWNKVSIPDYFQLMHKNAKRLLRLINQLIDFRKIDQNEKRLNISNNNIVEFTKEVVAAFSAQAEQKNIVLKFESQFPTINFWFDSDIMEKVFYNLISNAIKYTPERGKVRIQLSVNNEQSTVNSNQSYDSQLNTDNCLLITVKDTGIGIKKENIDKIFDRFYREETKNNFVVEGTGIGLAYTKELVELHKGVISVESEPGKETAFILQFPLENENIENRVPVEEGGLVNLEYIRSMIETQEAKNYRVEPETINEQNKDKPTILVVEDNTDLRKFIKKELLEQYNVFEAKNGKEGWDVAVENDPELIISDIMMPVMDGLELCKKIKNDENTSHIPVILLTAKEGEENTIQGLETGADDYITKPFNVNILKIKIANLFLLRERMRQKFSQSIDVVPSEITRSQKDQQFLQKAIEIVNENMGDYEFDTNAFVGLMNYSKTLIYNKIKNITGQSISEFIYSIRLKAAANLFIKGHTNIKEVSYNVGFKHPNTFSEYFRKMFGKPPRTFIQDLTKK